MMVVPSTYTTKVLQLNMVADIQTQVYLEGVGEGCAIKASVYIFKQWDVLDCIGMCYFSFSSVLCVCWLYLLAQLMNCKQWKRLMIKLVFKQQYLIFLS